MEEVKFNINGKTVYFRDTSDTIKTILEDDEYAFVYIKHALENGKLATYGLQKDTLITEFSRCAINQISSTSSENKNKRPIIPKIKTELIETVEENPIVWNHKHKPSELDIQATYALLEIRGKEEISKLFDDPKIVQIKVWEKVAKMLSDLGYNLGNSDSHAAERCRQKFTNLRKAYFNYKINIDMGKLDPEKPKPLFIDEMEQFCGEVEFIPKKMKIKYAEILDNSSNSVNTNIIDHDYLEIQPTQFLEEIDSYENIDVNKIVETLNDMHKKQIELQTKHHNEIMGVLKQQNEQRKYFNFMFESFLEHVTKKRKLDEI